MHVFEEVVEVNRKMFEGGKKPSAHAILVKGNKVVAMIALFFTDEFTKQQTFNNALPQVVREYIPEDCIFVLPSRVKMLDSETGKIIRREDAVIVYEVDAIKIKAAIIRKGKRGVEVIEPEEEGVHAPLMEPIRNAMKVVWADMI